jgi:acetyl-CoA synthetase
MLPPVPFATIRKSEQVRQAANLADYDRARREFSWAEACRALDGLPGGGLNIAHEAVDRHAAGPRSAVTVMRYRDHDSAQHDIGGNAPSRGTWR